MKAITTEASAKIAGYIFQIQRALYRILSSDASSLRVGIETEDDVAELIFNEQEQPQIILEQDKHSVNLSQNPYQDSSKNLWHSLHIWLDSMDECREKYSKIEYHLVTNNRVNPNSLVFKLADAIEKNEIDACIKLIREAAYNSKEGKGNFEVIRAVSSYPDQKLRFLIENLKLGDSNATKDETTLETAIKNLFRLPADCKKYEDEIYESLIGFIVSFCQEKWKLKQPAWLDQVKISNRLFQEISTRKFKKFLEQPLMSTEYKKYLSESNNEHLFLKQLTSLGMSDQYCTIALESYWGFYSEKVRLEDEGEVLPSEWEERNSVLHNRWNAIYTEETAFNFDLDELKISKNSIRRTLDPNYLAPLGGNSTLHYYFTAGNYHYLANSTKQQYFVYWHNSFSKGNL